MEEIESLIGIKSVLVFSKMLFDLLLVVYNIFRYYIK